jgi:hypothetical protein
LGETWRMCYLEGLRISGRLIWKWILRKQDRRVWTGLVWRRLRTAVGLLWKRQWTYEFHKMRGTSWLVEEVRTSQEGLSYLELVI